MKKPRTSASTGVIDFNDTANRRQLRYQLISFLILNIILNPKLFHKDKLSIFNIVF